MSRETDISRAIRKALERVGFRVMRMQAGTARGGRQRLAPAGCPDLYVIGAGWLEVKDEGELSDEQRQWHDYAQSVGERVAVVRSPAEAVRVCVDWRRSCRR